MGENIGRYPELYSKGSGNGGLEKNYQGIFALAESPKSVEGLFAWDFVTVDALVRINEAVWRSIFVVS